MHDASQVIANYSVTVNFSSCLLKHGFKISAKFLKMSSFVTNAFAHNAGPVC